MKDSVLHLSVWAAPGCKRATSKGGHFLHMFRMMLAYHTNKRKSILRTPSLYFGPNLLLREDKDRKITGIDSLW